MRSRRAILRDDPKEFDLENLRPFGCEAWAWLPKEVRAGYKSHVQLKARHGIMLGVQDGMNAYRLWDPAKRKVFFAAFQHVVTNEACFPWRDKKLWGKDELSEPLTFQVPEVGKLSDQLYDVRAAEGVCR